MAAERVDGEARSLRRRLTGDAERAIRAGLAWSCWGRYWGASLVLPWVVILQVDAYCAAQPPSTVIALPVTNGAVSE